MKVLARIYAIIIALIMAFIQAPAAGEADGAFYYRAIETPDSAHIAGYREDKLASVDEIHADDETVSVTILVESDCVVEEYRKESEWSDVYDFINSERGESIAASVRNEISRVEAELRKEESIEILGSFAIVEAGLSARMPYGMIEKVKELPGVRDVAIASEYRVCADSESFSAPMSAFSAASEDETEREKARDVYAKSQYGAGFGTMAVKDSPYSGQISKNNIYDTSALQNRGEGMLIAILDTGLSMSHEAFSVYPDIESAKIRDSGYLTDELKSKLYARYGVGNFYQNGKVVFKYDYAGRDFNVNPGLAAGFHGTHVAGIAAGNNGRDFYGVAPNAQLAVMKVFSDSTGLAETPNIVGALEDCLVIGVDVINMSLGMDAGLPEDKEYGDVVERLRSAGINLAVAAGNSADIVKRIYRDNLVPTTHPDYGVISSPSSFEAPMSVASSFEINGISAYSSIGPGCDLSLKPDITAPGEQVVSAVTGRVGAYQSSSGTSMASPNFAGAVAVMRKYLGDEYGLTGTDLASTAENLLMSTAYILGNGTPLSPRLQGAGVADITAAMQTKAYLTSRNGGRAKLEIGDDPGREGKFLLRFEIHNISDTPVEYDISQVTLTERAENGKCSGTPQLLSPTLRLISYTGATFDGMSCRVGAKSYAEAELELTLSEQDKAYLEANYKNGIYVEGYLIFDGNEIDLSMPFLGFYGDWKALAVLDPFNGYDDSTIFGKLTLNGAYRIDEFTMSSVQLGNYGYGSQSATFPDRVAVSFSENAIFGFSSVTNVALLRSIAGLVFTISDYETGEEIYSSDRILDAMSRTLVDDNGYKVNRPDFVNLSDISLYELGGERLFGNNGKYLFSLQPIGFDGEDLASRSTLFYVDSETPRILSAAKSGGTLSMTLYDNHYVQTFRPYVKKRGIYTPIGPYVEVSADSVGSRTEYNIDIGSQEREISESDDGRVYINLLDYARNESWYVFEIGADGSSFEQMGEEPDTESQNEYVRPDFEAISEDEDCFYDRDKVLYRRSEKGLVLVNYPEDMTLSSYSVLPGTVRIERGAFKNGGITGVILPESLTRIGDSAFYYCPALASVVAYGDAPVIETGADAKYDCFRTKPRLMTDRSGYDEDRWKEITVRTDYYSIDYISGQIDALSREFDRDSSELTLLYASLMRIESADPALAEKLNELFALAEIDDAYAAGIFRFNSYLE